MISYVIMMIFQADYGKLSILMIIVYLQFIHSIIIIYLPHLR